jgi:acyl-coenzyme A synthetase/AMP-(fatty) acid ligase
MITQLIFDWAQRTPERAAIIYNGQACSYQSFAEQIATARAYFLRRGYVGPGHVVLALHNRMDFWILSLALRSLGLTTVVVGTEAMFGDIGLPDIRCVITHPAEAWPNLAPLCKAKGLSLLSVSLEEEPSAGAALPAISHEPGGHILLTSGTTGRFKMVLHTPAIDTAFLRRIVDSFGMSRETVCTVFNFGAWTGIGYKWAASPWMVGGTTLIDSGREPYRALLNPLITHGVLVPGVLTPILAAPANAFARNEALQFIVTGGPMTRRQIEQVKARITPRLFTMVACTEAGGITCTLLETAEDSRWHRPLPQSVVEVVSESGAPVSAGELGRLRVGTKDGPVGYLGDETTTKLHFENGYFYPGDLAVTRADGRIALQGRSTDVINAAGLKIYPGPIEDRLCELLDVSGACLVSMQNEGGEEELYVLIETTTFIDAERVRAALNQAPRVFPRTHVRYVRSLPRNPMGKVMRQVVRDRITANPPLSN